MVKLSDLKISTRYEFPGGYIEKPQTVPGFVIYYNNEKVGTAVNLSEALNIVNKEVKNHGVRS